MSFLTALSTKLCRTTAMAMKQITRGQPKLATVNAKLYLLTFAEQAVFTPEWKTIYMVQ